MKFQIKLNLLKDYIKRLTFSVQSVSSRIEFTGILISVWDNSITFEGRNDYMDTKIEETSLTQVKIIETGRALIKASMLNEIIQKMEGDLVTFTKIDSNLIVVESQDSNYKINLLTDDNYEKAIILENMNEIISIPSNNFRDSVSKVIFAGNEFHPKFIYQGLNLIIEDQKMTTTVCDGIRIASHKSNISSELKLNKIIPIKVIKELIKILPSSIEEYKFSFSENKGTVVAGNMINQFSIIEGTFPVFDKFFNIEKYNKILKINKTIFSNSIDRATILTTNKNDGSSRVGINLSKDLIIIESREQEIGSAKIELKDFEFEGDNIEISISPKIISEGLRNSESEDVIIYLTTNQSSVLLKSEKDNLNYLMSPMM